MKTLKDFRKRFFPKHYEEEKRRKMTIGELAIYDADKSFKAICPKCYKINNFTVTEEELKNDYDFSCNHCEKQYLLSVWLSNPCNSDKKNCNITK